MILTNAARATWAVAALEGYRESHNCDGDLETDIGDLIGDLLHLLRRECGIEAGDLPQYLRGKGARHDEELREDPEE